MHSDSFFFKGKSHDVCEDYATHGSTYLNNKQVCYAIVSDGCSSSKDTDIGARVLTKAAEENLHLINYDVAFGDAVINKASEVVDFAGWNPYCLDATLLVATSEEDKTQIQVIGDGVVCLLNNDCIVVHDITYPSGAPRYLTYWSNNDRAIAYKNAYSNLRIVDTYYIFKDRTIKETTESEHPVWSIKVSNDTCQTIILTSDGVHSFQELFLSQGKTFSHIDLFNVLKEIYGFKNTNGEFVKRRIKRFAKTTSWENTDDLAVAAICVK